MNGKQLKNSILQWAIQGKLVPQNPKDEPASKLLERIAALRVIASGAKQSKKNPASRIYREGSSWFEQVGSADPKDITEEIPFDIPESWEWCRLRDLTESISAGGDKPEKCFKEPTQECRIPVFSNGETNKGLYGFTDVARVFKPSITVSGRGTIGYTCIRREPYVPIVRLISIIPLDCLTLEYLEKSLSLLIVQAAGIGTSIPQLTVPMLAPKLMPLPPYEEQKRIVKKLEQILPLVDEYDQAQTQLDKLNKELPEALKKSILQQAIQGKLVLQNPKDEPAQKLLERIIASRNGCSINQGVILSEAQSAKSKNPAKKKSKNETSRIYRDTDGLWYEQIGSSEPVIITEEIPFEIPETWTWCRLGCICGYLHRGKSPTYSEKKILPVMAQKCNQWDRIYTDKCLFVDPQTIEKYAPEQYLQKGDTLINSTGGGTVGRTGYVDDYVFAEYDKFVADSHVTVVRPNENICSKYVYYYLITPYIQTGLEERCAGSTNQIELGTETVRNYLLPLPPLAEQKRIVAKLEQLFKTL